MAKVSEAVRSTLTSAATGYRAPGHYLKTTFESKGVTVLGAGMYGAAIEENGNIFKIFGKEEKGYGAYLNYLKGKSSVLNPRVKVIGSFGAFTCVHIERLHHMGDEIGHDLAYAFAEWASYVARKAFNKAGGDEWFCKAPFPKGAEQFVNKANMAGMLKKLAVFAYNHFKENEQDMTWDLHSGNFMVRRNEDGTKQIVLTDPFCA